MVTVSDLSGPGIKPKTSRVDCDVFNHYANRAEVFVSKAINRAEVFVSKANKLADFFTLSPLMLSVMLLITYRQSSRLRGARRSSGEPKFEIKQKSCYLQKRKLVNWGGAKHVDWGDNPPPPPGPSRRRPCVQNSQRISDC